MKHNFKLMYLSVFILGISSCAQNNGTFTEQKIKAINDEINQSFYQGDLSVIEKYLYKDTEIFIDMDPDPSLGVQQISLVEYRELTKMALTMIDKIDIKEEIVEVEIDEKKDEATLVVNTQVSTNIMGMKTYEESISTTLFGVIDGEIKILKTSDQLVSIEAE